MLQTVAGIFSWAALLAIWLYCVWAGWGQEIISILIGKCECGGVFRNAIELDGQTFICCDQCGGVVRPSRR